MTGASGQHIRSRAFDRHFLCVKFAAPQFVEKKIAYRGLVWSDGFNIDQTAGEPEEVHAQKA
jgi:hypothetical protein